MTALIGWPLAVLVITAIAARVAVTRLPDASYSKQVFWAALGFPAVAVALFVIAVVVTLVSASGSSDPGAGPGMPIFAFTFFLVYALMGAAVIGLPTAFVAVRIFRGR